MLGKLFVSEIKQTYKPMAITGAVLVLSTLLANLESNIMKWMNVASDNILGSIITGMMNMLFVFSVIAVLIVGFVFLIIGFYKSMYSERGYLTHTLPVSSVTTFNVKLLVAVLWMAAAAVVIVSCFLFRALNITGESLGEFIGRLQMIFRITDPEFKGILFIGKSLGGTVVRFSILGLLGILGSFLFYFTAITIGQLSNEHKVGCAIGAGVVLYMIQQMLGFVVMIVCFIGYLAKDAVITNEIAILNRGAIATIIVYTLFMAVQYVVDLYIVKNRLNLQ
ncbi:MAG: hypothetical protein K6G60_04450 [Lachnospiraceae bacterium]|nr:hypothetical protein [Lachnospiraceae bacterium]